MKFIYQRDSTYPITNYIKMYHDIPKFGYIFQMETLNQIMYFQVKSRAGNYRSFQFTVVIINHIIKYFFTKIMTLIYITINHCFVVIIKIPMVVVLLVFQLEVLTMNGNLQLPPITNILILELEIHLEI